MTDKFFVLVLVLALSPEAWQDRTTQSQTPPSSALPSSAQDVATPPAKAAPVPELAPITISPADTEVRRDNITIMEGVLASAVGTGGRRVQADNPGVTLVPTGQPRARGFVLESYGVFFDVEIPELNGSIELSVQQFQREIDKLREGQTNSTRGPQRTGQNLPAVADNPDPGAFYRVAVISAVASAMLDYSKNLNVQPNEWLTVGLRGSESPTTQLGFRESRTVLLRIKGSDLADYLASRVSKEEVLKRVEKREF
jgi:hypothetical protein